MIYTTHIIGQRIDVGLEDHVVTAVGIVMLFQRPVLHVVAALAAQILRKRSCEIMLVMLFMPHVIKASL